MVTKDESLVTGAVLFTGWAVLFYPLGLTVDYFWKKLNGLMGTTCFKSETVSEATYKGYKMATTDPKKVHKKARTSPYPRTSDVYRVDVPDDRVPWNVSFDYTPKNYTSDAVLKGPVWADKDIKSGEKHKINFNCLDGIVNRKSFVDEYKVDSEGLPRNPMGRTGITGRGSLGRWGPNHAADPIVTRWKNKDKRVLQFIAVQRRDNGEWAIPGGMVDAGEEVSQTLKREFGEEALNTLDATDTEKKKLQAGLDKLFSSGKVIYHGYVDDPRNTDNAWMETVAMNFHDEHGDSAAQFELNAGDDAMGVQWMDINRDIKLYASHEEFIRQAAQLHNAWK